jgi:hypothetical protein
MTSHRSGVSCLALGVVAVALSLAGTAPARAQVCTHDICDAGTPLNSSCDSCVADICQTDSYCCAYDWDSQCIDEVSSVCGQTTCTAACSHGLCETGDALDATCNSCAAKICAANPECCGTAWDASCVAAIATECTEWVCLQGADKCVDAVPIPNREFVRVMGTLKGMTNNGCASVGDSCQQPDVWYSYTMGPEARAATTCGTQYSFGIDTVVSVHSTCPGNVNSEIIADDDWKFGPFPESCIASYPRLYLDSGLPIPVSEGETVLLRVSHYVDSPENDFQLYVPEPSSLLLGVAGAATLACVTRARRRRSGRGR